MSASRFHLLLLATVFSSFLGGMTTEYLRGELAVADEMPRGMRRLRAERVEIVDEHGRVRMSLGPDLLLMEDDTSGTSERIVLGATGLLLAKASPEQVLELSLGPSGMLVVENGRPRLDASLRGGEPSVRLRDDQGRLRAALGPSELDPLGATRGAFSLALFDMDGNRMWTAP